MATRGLWSAGNDPRHCRLAIDDVHEIFVQTPSRSRNGHPTPSELLNGALASSILMRMARFVRRAALAVDSLEVEVAQVRITTGFMLTMTVKVAGNVSDEIQARMLSVANRDPMHRMLAGKTAIVTLDTHERHSRQRS